MGFIARVFGKPSGKTQYEKEDSHKKSLARGDRTAPLLREDEIAEFYTNVKIIRRPDGYYEAICKEPGHEMHEIHEPSGVGSIVTSKGSLDTFVPGFSRNTIKGGKIETTQGSTCEKYGSQMATYVGGPKHAGRADQTKGNVVTLALGAETGGVAMASGKGTYCIGKHVINAEGGCAMGVNQGSSRKIYQRMEPDGTYHLQVTPAGDSGGNATIKIDPNGEITITSAKSMNVTAAQNINFDCATFNIKGNMTLKGNFNQQGVHTDSNGVHTKCPC